MPRWVVAVMLIGVLLVVPAPAVADSGPSLGAARAVQTMVFPPRHVVVRTAGTSLNERAGPSTADKIVGRIANGRTVWVACQRFGQQIAGAVSNTAWWAQLTDGRYV